MNNACNCCCVRFIAFLFLNIFNIISSNYCFAFQRKNEEFKQYGKKITEIIDKRKINISWLPGKKVIDIDIKAQKNIFHKSTHCTLCND